MYIAKAYVKIESVSKRLELAKKLQEAGIRCLFSVRNGFEKIFVIRGGIAGVILGDNIQDHIDCNSYTPNGTEEEAVKLFLELAQIRDDTGSDARWIICDLPHFDDMYNKTFERDEVIDSWKYQQVDKGLFSVATPLEVAEAFKEGRIGL